jgi:tripartite-type tricarboxylate transporter receptor subunit TctC
MNGQLQLMFATTNAGVPLAKAGRLRGLASSSAHPSPLLPDLPTVAATLPGYRAEAVYGIWGPAKMQAALISRLSQEVNRVVSQPDVKEKFFVAGLESVGSTPEQFDAEIKGEMATMGKMIRDAGIHGD